MTIRETLKSYFAPVDNRSVSIVPERKAVDVFMPNGQRIADWSGIYGPRFQSAATTCVTVYACATLLADAVAESPLRVYSTAGGQKKELPDHRARQLIANPNPKMSEAEFMTLIVMTMAYCGYAAVEKVRSNAGLPVELWPLRPDWLTREKANVIVNNEPTIQTRWVYRAPTKDARYLPESDVIIVPYRHDHLQSTFGVSPIQIAAREIGIDVSLTDLLKTFLDAGGIPPYVLEYPEEITDKADIKLFQEAWRQKYGGSKAYGEIPVLHGGWHFVKIGDGVNDMAWPDLRGLTEVKIAQAFRVPADLIQIRDTLKSGSLTTTEMDGAMRFLQRHGAAPLRTRIDGALTRELLAEFGAISSLELAFDTSEILALQEEQNELHDRVRADYEAGLITLNQAMEETGRPTLGPRGDVYRVPFTANFVTLPQLSAPVVSPVKDDRQIADVVGKQTEPIEEKLIALPSTSSAVPLPQLVTAFAPYQEKLTEIGTRKLTQLVAAKSTDFDPYRQLFYRLFSEVVTATTELVGSEIADDVALRSVCDMADDRLVQIYDGIAQDIANTPDPTDLLSADYHALLTKTIAQEIAFAHRQVVALTTERIPA